MRVIVYSVTSNNALRYRKPSTKVYAADLGIFGEITSKNMGVNSGARAGKEGTIHEKDIIY